MTFIDQILESGRMKHDALVRRASQNQSHDLLSKWKILVIRRMRMCYLRVKREETYSRTVLLECIGDGLCRRANADVPLRIFLNIYQ